jgi:hypothetical protein
VCNKEKYVITSLLGNKSRILVTDRVTDALNFALHSLNTKSPFCVKRKTIREETETEKQAIVKREREGFFCAVYKEMMCSWYHQSL